MKQFSKLFFAAAVAALGLASCAKEVAQVETPKDNLVTVHFGAKAGIEGATKATLTPDEQETLFTSAWEKGDVLSVKYFNDNMAEAQGVHATWNETSYSFSTALPEFTGRWIYRAAYPAPEADGSVEFGSSRTQKGNDYNSKYDLMRGTTMTEAPAGKTDDGKDIIFDMTRETAIAYFHFTSKLAEKVVSAKLSVTDGSIANSSVTTDYDNHFVFSDDKPLNEITITFEEGTAPDATDFKLWYNVRQTNYSSMTLEVETTGHKMTISRNSSGAYYSGKLYKVVKDIDDKWVAKGGETPGTKDFVLVTSAQSDWSGSYLLVGANDVNYYAFDESVYENSTWGKCSKVVVENNTIASTYSTMAVDVVPGTTENTYSILTPSGKYLSASAKGAFNLDGTYSADNCDFTISFDEKNVLVIKQASSTKNRQIRYNYNNGNGGLRWYEGTSVEPVYLYKGPSIAKYLVSFASVEGGTLSASAIKAEEGTEITLTAEPLLGYEFNNDWSVTATDGTVINVVDNKFTMPAQDVTVSGTFTSNIKYDHAGTENDPYNVLDVLKLIETLKNGASSSEINAKGVIKSIKEVSTTYKNATYTIGDETTSETVTIYRGKYINGADFTSTDQIKIGDEVVIKGRVTNYKGSKQFSTGSRIVSLKRIEPCATPVITIAEGGVVSIACETAGATIHYTVGDSPADPTESDKVFSTVTLTEGQTIKAIAVAEGYKQSAVASKKYVAGGESPKTYTLQFGEDYNSTKKDTYSNSWSATCDGFTWNMTNWSNYNNGWNYVKAGPKGNTNAHAKIETAAAMPEAISKISITIDNVANGSITSIVLKTSTTNNFTSGTTIETKLAVVKGEAVFTIPSPQNNLYYQLDFTLNNTTTGKKAKNGVATVSKVVYTNN